MCIKLYVPHRSILMYILAILNWSNNLEIKIKGTNSWWRVNLICGNQHTCIEIHIFSLKIGLEHQLEIWSVEWTPSQDFYWCIFATLRIHLVTSYRWVQTRVVFFPPNQLHNHMANVQVMCLHFCFRKHLYNLSTK
jgi:hypothetical protein